MTWDEQGLANCACHAKKAAPILDACADYSGTNGNYANMIHNIRKWIFGKRNTAEIQLLKEWYWKGLLSDVLEPDEITSFEEKLGVCLDQQH